MNILIDLYGDDYFKYAGSHRSRLQRQAETYRMKESEDKENEIIRDYRTVQGTS